MDTRLRNKGQKEDKKDYKTVTSKEGVVAKSNIDRSETGMAKVNMNSTLCKSEDSQSTSRCAQGSFSLKEN